MGEKIVQTGIRMPESLNKRIEKVAKKEKRSKNAQMILMLEESLLRRNG